MASEKTPEVGDKASWSWNGSAPSGEVAEKKSEGEVSVQSKRGNTIKKAAQPNDPAIHLARPGNDVVKNQSELHVDEKAAPSSSDANGTSKEPAAAPAADDPEDQPEASSSAAKAQTPAKSPAAKRKATEEPEGEKEAKKSRGRPKGATAATPKEKKAPKAKKEKAPPKEKKEKAAKADDGEKKGRGRPAKDPGAPKAAPKPKKEKKPAKPASKPEGVGKRTRSQAK